MDTVFCFDLDGTITRHELLPLIGEKLNLFEEINSLTEDTIAGRIPFDQSFALRVKILSQVPLSDIQEVVLSVPCYEQLLEWIKSHRQNCFIVTGNLDIWVKPWLDRHSLKGFTSSSQTIGSSYVITNTLRKESILDNFLGNRTVMIGEGANDARIMEMCDVGIATELTHKVSTLLWEHADYLVGEEKALCQLLTRLL